MHMATTCMVCILQVPINVRYIVCNMWIKLSIFYAFPHNFFHLHRIGFHFGFILFDSVLPAAGAAAYI